MSVLRLVGLLGALGVCVGAYTAHGLREHLVERGFGDVADKRVQQAETGVRYHLFHTVAILAMGAMTSSYGKRKYVTIIASMTAGIVFFSGSLYLLAALNRPALGAITPIGGLLWIVAWVLVALPSRRGQDDSQQSAG